MIQLLKNAVLLMLLVFAIPLIIIVVGAPIVLCARAVIEIAQRF